MCGDSIPDEYANPPGPEGEEALEIEMGEDDKGNDSQTRRTIRDLQDTTSDYAYSYLPIVIDFLTFMRSDTRMEGFSGGCCFPVGYRRSFH